MNIIQLDTKQIPLPDNSVDMIFSDPPYVKDLIHTYDWLAQEAARVLKPGKFVLRVRDLLAHLDANVDDSD